MAEALLAHYSAGRFKSLSAGSFPAGYVHPISLGTLEKQGIATEGFSSKSWNEFADEKIDIVITVCDNAAGESCPLFLGKWVKAHWGVPDPAKFEGSEQEIADEFLRVFHVLERRIQMLIHLPVEIMIEENL